MNSTLESGNFNSDVGKEMEKKIKSIQESEFYERIKSEKINLFNEIKRMIENCSIFNRIEEIIKLEEVKRIYVLNRVGETINKILNLLNMDLNLIPELKELIKDIKENQKNSNIRLPSMIAEPFTPVSKSPCSNRNYDISTTLDDHLVCSEEEFKKCLDEIKNKFCSNFDKNLEKSAKRDIENFFKQLNQNLNTDFEENRKKLLSIFISILIVSDKILDIDFYFRTNLNNIVLPSDKEFNNLNDPITEEIIFSRNLFVPEFNTNIISCRLNDIFKKKPKLELNDSEKIICDACQSYFFGNDMIQYDKWTCKFCLKNNSFDTKMIKKSELNFSNYTDVEYKKISNTQKILPSSNTKLFIICIDISGSMSGSRIEIAKKASLKALDQLKEKGSEHKVALVSFQSEAFYYGDGRKEFGLFGNSQLMCVQIKNNIDNLDKTEIVTSITSKASSLRPIRDSYYDLKEAIEKLMATGGTRILSALIESVILASTESNSEILLCTDGIADDRDTNSYQKITKFCNRLGAIKINIITFPESDCQLETLGILANETNGFLEKLTINDHFEKSFLHVTDKFVITQKSESIKFIVLSQKDVYLEDTNSNRYEKEYIDSNLKEILIKFEPQEFNKNELYFQFQIEMRNSIRVITKKVTGPKVNEKLVIAYSIRKLSNLVLDKSSNLDNFNKEFYKYLKSRGIKSEESETIISEIEMKKTSGDDNYYLKIHKNKNINSDDISFSKTKALQIKNEFENEFENDENFKQFKTKIGKNFDDLISNQFGIKDEMNIYKLFLSTRLIEKSMRIIKFLNKHVDNSKNMNSELNSCDDQLDSFENILKILKQQINIDISQNLIYIDENNEVDHFTPLIEKLNNFYLNKQTEIKKDLPESLRRIVDFTLAPFGLFGQYRRLTDNSSDCRLSACSSKIHF